MAHFGLHGLRRQRAGSRPTRLPAMWAGSPRPTSPATSRIVCRGQTEPLPDLSRRDIRWQRSQVAPAPINSHPDSPALWTHDSKGRGCRVASRAQRRPGGVRRPSSVRPASRGSRRPGWTWAYTRRATARKPSFGGMPNQHLIHDVAPSRIQVCGGDGQAGPDRGGLDAAIYCDLPHGASAVFT